MAQPPEGYSLQRGAYFTDDGQGPYAWDGTTMRLIGEASAFSGAAADVAVTDSGAHFPAASPKNVENVLADAGARIEDLEANTTTDLARVFLGMNQQGRNGVKFGLFIPAGFNTTNITNVGLQQTIYSTFGANTGPTGANYADTSVVTRTARQTYASAGAAGNAVGWRFNVNVAWGNSAGDSGGAFQTILGCTDTQAGTLFVGYSTATITDIDPIDMVNVFGVGADEGDTGFSLYWNDGTGQATKTPLGNGWNPNDNTELYFYQLIISADGETATLNMVRMSDGATYSTTRTRTVAGATGGFPVVSTQGGFHVLRGSATAVAKGLVHAGTVMGDLRVAMFGAASDAGGGGSIDLANPDPWTKAQDVTAVSLGPVSGALVIDTSLSNTFYGTLSGNVTSVTLTNGRSGRRVSVQLKQAASGGPYTVAYGSLKSINGTPGSMSSVASVMDTVDFVYYDADAGFRYAHTNGVA